MFYICNRRQYDEDEDETHLERFRGAGQPEVLASRARAWADEMHRAGFDLLVVYDGSDPDAKLQTAFGRAQGRFARNVEASVAMAGGRMPSDPKSHLPTGAGATIMEALRRCPNVGLYRDVVEADAILAACARTFASGDTAGRLRVDELRCAAAPGPSPPAAPVHAVLGNDSDFFIFGCRYIELRPGFFQVQRLSARRSAIDALVWEPDALHSMLGLSTAQAGRWEAALFATLVGNDYADRECSALRKLHAKLGCALPLHSERVIGLRTVNATGGTLVTIEPPPGVDTGRHRALATYTNNITAADGVSAVASSDVARGALVSFAIHRGRVLAPSLAPLSARADVFDSAAVIDAVAALVTGALRDAVSGCALRDDASSGATGPNAHARALAACGEMGASSARLAVLLDALALVAEWTAAERAEMTSTVAASMAQYAITPPGLAAALPRALRRVPPAMLAAHSRCALGGVALVARECVTERLPSPGDAVLIETARACAPSIGRVRTIAPLPSVRELITAYHRVGGAGSSASVAHASLPLRAKHAAFVLLSARAGEELSSDGGSTSSSSSSDDEEEPEAADASPRAHGAHQAGVFPLPRVVATRPPAKDGQPTARRSALDRTVFSVPVLDKLAAGTDDSPSWRRMRCSVGRGVSAAALSGDDADAQASALCDLCAVAVVVGHRSATAALARARSRGFALPLLTLQFLGKRHNLAPYPLAGADGVRRPLVCAREIDAVLAMVVLTEARRSAGIGPPPTTACSWARSTPRSVHVAQLVSTVAEHVAEAVRVVSLADIDGVVLGTGGGGAAAARARIDTRLEEWYDSVVLDLALRAAEESGGSGDAAPSERHDAGADEREEPERRDERRRGVVHRVMVDDDGRLKNFAFLTLDGCAGRTRERAVGVAVFLHISKARGTFAEKTVAMSRLVEDETVLDFTLAPPDAGRTQASALDWIIVENPARRAASRDAEGGSDRGAARIVFAVAAALDDEDCVLPPASVRDAATRFCMIRAALRSVLPAAGPATDAASPSGACEGSDAAPLNTRAAAQPPREGAGATAERAPAAGKNSRPGPHPCLGRPPNICPYGGQRPSKGRGQPRRRHCAKCRRDEKNERNPDAKHPKTIRSKPSQSHIPCRFFGKRKGCLNGDECPFSHGAAVAAPQPRRVAKRAAAAPAAAAPDGGAPRAPRRDHRREPRREEQAGSAAPGRDVARAHGSSARESRREIGRSAARYDGRTSEALRANQPASGVAAVGTAPVSAAATAVPQLNGPNGGGGGPVRALRSSGAPASATNTERGVHAAPSADADDDSDADIDLFMQLLGCT
jgi:hypothetical protein